MELFDTFDFGNAPANSFDPDTEEAQTTAWKMFREFDRLRGLLRFTPETEQRPETSESAQGGAKVRYIARCAPDHFVLPLLADHFVQRFGETSWAIIDEKRNLVLSCEGGTKPVLHRAKAKENGANPKQKDSCDKDLYDEWEELWKNYHRSINNEARSNPRLQKQFMPSRYWKYLPEME